jgi:hypothetical protein
MGPTASTRPVNPDNRIQVLIQTSLAATPRHEANLRRMEHAIATHQFERARFYSHVDLRLRERLNRPQEE